MMQCVTLGDPRQPSGTALVPRPTAFSRLHVCNRVPVIREELALLGLLDFSNDVLDRFLDRPRVFDIKVDPGSWAAVIAAEIPNTRNASAPNGDDLVGVYPNRVAVGESELEHWHSDWLLQVH